LKVNDGKQRPNGLKQEDVDYLERQHIHFSIPLIDGKVSDAFLVAMMKFVVISRDLGIQFSIDTMKYDAVISRARNNLVARFMTNTHATHLMFLDADLVFDAEDIVRLLLARKEIVGGVYPVRDFPIKYDFNPIEMPGDEKSDLVPVAELSTGFMLITKGAIEKMIQNYTELKYKGVGMVKESLPYTFAFFDTSLDADGNYLTEYQTFSRRWRDIGGELFADVGLRVDHISQIAIPSNPEDIITMLNNKFKKSD
jgi:hypothetical protein